MGLPKAASKADICQRPAPSVAFGIVSSSIALWVATASKRPGSAKAMRRAA